MTDNLFLLRQVLAVASALLYWGGVILNMYHIKRSIGKFPNIKPKGLKEKVLWLGWFFIIAGWIVQPFVIVDYEDSVLFHFIILLMDPVVIGVAVIMLVGGYLGTIWCYTVLGASWRIGIDKSERVALVKHGPYRMVRHPIYVFQIIIVIGMFFLLPTLFSLLILSVLILCVLLKTKDEEKYLTGMYGDEYRDYSLRTGKFFPQRKLL
jgi:protein-S-isoprenylcysteine O-methyltransferase Ste14